MQGTPAFCARVSCRARVQHQNGGFCKWGYPHSWMVYFMENPIKMDDNWGTPILGNLQMLI